MRARKALLGLCVLFVLAPAARAVAPASVFIEDLTWTELREEAEQLLADYQRRQREAAADAEAMIAHARDEAERIAAQSASELEQALARRQRLAEERIAQAEAKALDEIRAVAVDVAIGAAREVIQSQIDEERGAALLDAAIAALPQRLR